MDARDKKLTVLHWLSQQDKPISMNDLMNLLGEGFSERSVRRWLSEMVQEGRVTRLGQKKAARYEIAKQKIGPTGKVGSCFGSHSVQAIEHVRLPLYTRKPVAYAEDWLAGYEPNVTFYMPAHYRAQLHEAGKRSSEGDPAGTYAHQIFNRLLIDLSYNSSRLEGNTYSLLDTERLLLKGKGVEGKLEEEKIMILNHKDAIRYLVDSAPKLKISVETICTLHYLLSDGLVDSRDAGKVRDHGVRIGGSTYIPMENPKTLQHYLAAVLERAGEIADPFEQSFFLLVHISYLQAFADVNKRTARLSANIPLIQHNLVPLSFNDVEKEDYISAVIAIYELQEIRPLLDLYVYSYLRTCVLYTSTIKTVGFDEVRVRYREKRRAMIRHIIEHQMFAEEMEEYIFLQISSVKEEEREAFREDLFEDLEYLDVSRIAGLGITPDQLQTWLSKRERSLRKE